jgi:hypothetical protein
MLKGVHPFVARPGRLLDYVIGSDGSLLGNNIPAEQRNQYWGPDLGTWTNWEPAA